MFPTHQPVSESGDQNGESGDQNDESDSRRSGNVTTENGGQWLFRLCSHTTWQHCL
jgi:hypothetical protein